MPSSPRITWKDGALLRDGRPHRVLSGAMHYFRVHPDLWEDRLRRLAAMGANTVDTYVAWNFHERVEGEYDFSGWRDIERFIRLAGDVGLDVFVRPSPYICAEWSNGGIPFWLSARTRALRTSDPVFTEAVDAWFDQLIPRIAPLQAAHGGPVVMLQVENEYGSFGSDSAYLEHQRDGLRDRGIVEMLTTADGTTRDMVDNGSVDGAMRTFTFGTNVPEAVALLHGDEALMSGELWGGWFDHWGTKHHTRSAQSMIGTIDQLLDAGGSVNLYMAHGGTNFGFWNGANFADGVLKPPITSYDSDAPISEDGSINEKFHALRRSFAPFHEGELPPVPEDPPLMAPAAADLVRRASLLDLVARAEVRATAPMPLTYDELGAEDGLVAYQAHVSFPAGEKLHVLGLRDRATIFLDEQRLGTLEHDGAHELALPEAAGEGLLTIVVESLGRINYGAHTGEGKGILRGVTVERRYVHGWTHRVLGDAVPADAAGAALARDDAAGIATAVFEVDEPLDAWLAFPDGVKGLVWLNGFLLGRYWDRGPQVTLYAPRPLWRAGRNELVVLDTDSLGTRIEVREGPDFGEAEVFTES